MGEIVEWKDLPVGKMTFLQLIIPVGLEKGAYGFGPFQGFSRRSQGYIGVLTYGLLEAGCYL